MENKWESIRINIYISTNLKVHVAVRASIYSFSFFRTNSWIRSWDSLRTHIDDDLIEMWRGIAPLYDKRFTP